MVKTLEQKRNAKAARIAKDEHRGNVRSAARAVARARIKAYCRHYPFTALVRELDGHVAGSPEWMKVAAKIIKELR